MVCERQSGLAKSASHRVGLIVLASASLTIAACTKKEVQTPQAAPVPVVVAPVKPVFTATPGLSQRDRLKRALTLLGNGEEGQARAEIAVYLVEDPDSDTAKGLLDQIDRDPRDLLGYQSFSYTLRSGETLSVIAERYLNDRYKFWALAKYNNISNPAGVSVGQAILIPGMPRTVVARPASSRSDDDEINDRIEKDKKKKAAVKPVAAPAPAPTPAPAPAPAPVVVADAKKAQSYRRQGLEQLRRGNVDIAIRALNTALSFAKGTSLYTQIVNDLQQAQKIKANLKK
jgi:hypothetical protein